MNRSVFLYFGADFLEMPDSEKLFCGIWAFLIVIVRHSFSLSCHFPVISGFGGESQKIPGLNPGMTLEVG